MGDVEMIIRFDDICANTCLDEAIEMARYVSDRWGHEPWFCVSPIVSGSEKERVFPSIYKAYSDYKKFFEVDAIGLPRFPKYITKVSHGLIHIDHRLLDRSAQEMSIIVSCNLVDSNIFVPPFNKWNKDTEEICKSNGIKLIKFEDGWLSMEYNHHISNHEKWYCHPRCWSLEKIKEWFCE